MRDDEENKPVTVFLSDGNDSLADDLPGTEYVPESVITLPRPSEGGSEVKLAPLSVAGDENDQEESPPLTPLSQVVVDDRVEEGFDVEHADDPDFDMGFSSGDDDPTDEAPLLVNDDVRSVTWREELEDRESDLSDSNDDRFEEEFDDEGDDGEREEGLDETRGMAAPRALQLPLASSLPMVDTSPMMSAPSSASVTIFSSRGRDDDSSSNLSSDVGGAGVKPEDDYALRLAAMSSLGEDTKYEDRKSEAASRSGFGMGVKYVLPTVEPPVLSTSGTYSGGVLAGRKVITPADQSVLGVAVKRAALTERVAKAIFNVPPTSALVQLFSDVDARTWLHMLYEDAGETNGVLYPLTPILHAIFGVEPYTSEDSISSYRERLEEPWQDFLAEGMSEVASDETTILGKSGFSTVKELEKFNNLVWGVHAQVPVMLISGTSVPLSQYVRTKATTGWHTVTSAVVRFGPQSVEVGDFSFPLNTPLAAVVGIYRDRFKLQ